MIDDRQGKREPFVHFIVIDIHIVSGECWMASSSLHWASASGDKVEVKRLIDNKVDVNSPDTYGTTALHSAVKSGHVTIAQYLLANKADVNARDRFNKTPFYHVQSVEMADLLFAQGGDPNVSANDGTDCMSMCLKQKRFAIIQRLLESENYILPVDAQNSLLTELMKNGLSDSVRLFLSKCGDEIDLKNLISIAIENNHLDALEFTMQKATDQPVYGYPWQQFLQPHSRTKQGDSFLHLAVKYNYTSLVPEILKAGWPADLVNTMRQTPLHYVKTLSNATDLILSGCNVNAADEDAKTPLHYIRNAEIIALLIRSGANPNAKDVHGRTPLFYTDNMAAAKILVENGTDPFTMDVNRQFAYDFNPVYLVKAYLSNLPSIQPPISHHNDQERHQSLVMEIDDLKIQLASMQNHINSLTRMIEEHDDLHISIRRSIQRHDTKLSNIERDIHNHHHDFISHKSDADPDDPW